MRHLVLKYIGKLKKGSKPVYDPTRECQILRQLKNNNNGPFSNSDIESIFRKIMLMSLYLQVNREQNE